MAESIEKVKALIASRLEQIVADAGDLGRALAALSPERGRPRRPRRRRKAAGPRRPRTAEETSPHPRDTTAGRRAGSGTREPLAAIEARPGSSAAEIAATIGIRNSQAHVLIAKVKADRLIVRDGDGYRLKGS